MTRVRTLLTTLIVLAMVSFSFATESHASRGLIIDNPQRKIVGIWVEVKDGNSGWANWSYSPKNCFYSAVWNYDTQGKMYQLHIGVGGTPQNWGASIPSGWIAASGYHMTTCNIFQLYGVSNVVKVNYIH